MERKSLGKLKDIDFDKIKVVVFDFDYTLYCGGEWSEYEIRLCNFFVEKNVVNTPEEAYEMELKLKTKVGDEFHRLIKFARNCGIDPQELVDYNNEHFYHMDRVTVIPIDGNLFSELKNYYPIFIASDSPPKYLEYYMKKFGFKREDFAEVLSNEFKNEDCLKTDCFKRVLDITKVNPDEILMVGDNYKMDVETANMVGFQTFHVHGIQDTEKIIKRLIENKKRNKQIKFI